MNSVMLTRSFVSNARSPASEGEYSYKAEADARTFGKWEYAGGGRAAGMIGAGAGCGDQ